MKNDKCAFSLYQNFCRVLAPLDRRNVSRTVRAVVLAGGESRNPLARYRAMPSVPVASSITLVDIPINNCLRAGINKLYVLTQFMSHTLNSHIAMNYPPIRLPGPDGAAWVDVLAAQQTVTEKGWSRGSAEAIRKNIPELKDETRGIEPATDYVVLSGSAVYNLDIGKVLAYHRACGSDITMVTCMVPESEAQEKGIVNVHPRTGHVLEFVEKPDSKVLQGMRQSLDRITTDALGSSGAVKDSKGAVGSDVDQDQYMANMGIYVFRRDALFELIEDQTCTHLGFDVIPMALARGMNVFAFQHTGFWRDVSSLKDYFETNLAFASPDSPIKMSDVDGPTTIPKSRVLPPAMIQGEAAVDNSLIDDGAVLVDCSIQDSVIGQCVFVGRGTRIERSMLLGSPFWTSENLRKSYIARGDQVFGVGDNCTLRNCIIDENVTIGNNVEITNAAGVKEADREEDGYVIQDGIVVVLRNAVIPDGTRI